MIFIVLFPSIFSGIYSYIPNILGILFYCLSGIAVIFTFYFTNLTLFLLIPFFSQKAIKLFSINLILPSIIALAVTFIELFTTYKIHTLF